MCTTTLHLRLEQDVKEQATDVFEQLGLDLPTAIRIFLKKSIAEDGMPFELKNNRSDWDRMPCSWTVDELKEQVAISMKQIELGQVVPADEAYKHFMDFDYAS